MPELVSTSTPTVAPSRPRQDSSIQALRGLAVLLMVAGHVIGVGHRGLEVGDHSAWHYWYMALADIRMPLFTLISGYVYAMSPVSEWRQFPRLMRGKSRRLLIPLLTVGALYYFMECVIPGSHSRASDIPFWRVYVFGFEHLWFLQSIFLIFLIVGVLDCSGMLGSRSRWVVVVAAAAVLFVLVHVPASEDVFTISGALRLLPFFTLGYGLRRFGLEFRGAILAAVLFAFAAIFTLRLMTIFELYHPVPLGTVDKTIAVTVGLTGLILVYSSRKLLDVKILSWIGGFSFGIYLLHVLATASTRDLLERLGEHHSAILFVCGLTMGVAAPIAFQLLFRDTRFVQTFILGERRSVGRHARDNSLRERLSRSADRLSPSPETPPPGSFRTTLRSRLPRARKPQRATGA
jgi:peptidoglycan/LPS O-acetylase OafA/YrhL